MPLEELKERQAVIWGAAPLERYTPWLVAMHDDLVERDSPETGESGGAVWQKYVDVYGPSRTLTDSLEPERRAELARTMADFFDQYRRDGGVHQPRAYYVILGKRR